MSSVDSFCLLAVVLLILVLIGSACTLPRATSARRAFTARARSARQTFGGWGQNQNSSQSDKTTSSTMDDKHVLLATEDSGDMSTCSVKDLLSTLLARINELENQTNQTNARIGNLETTVSSNWDLTVRTDRLIEIRNKYYEDLDWNMRLSPLPEPWGKSNGAGHDYIHIQKDDPGFDETSKWYIKQFDDDVNSTEE